MSKKHILAEFYAVMLLFVANSLFAGTLPDNMELGTKLSLFGSYANTSENFLAKYKTSSLRFDIDFAYHVMEELSFNFLPYAQGSYDVNRPNKTETKIKIWQAYFNYNLADFNFNLGRFDFADKSLAPFIYYGDDLPLDLALPTSLDGFRHSFTHKYFSYTWLNIAGFYFYQNKKYPESTYEANSKLSIYGAGLDLFFSESSGFHFYGARNAGYKEEIRPSLTTKEPYRGYAFNGEIYYQDLYKTGTLNNKFGFYLFSHKDQFQTSANKLQTGIIYCGTNYIDILYDDNKVRYH